MEIITVDTKTLYELYEGSALTFVGCNTDEDNLNFLKEWLYAHGSPMIKDEVYLTKGKLMNETFNLVGDDEYKDDLSIVSVKLDNLENPMNIVLARFELRGRWMDDIIMNDIGKEWEYKTEGE